MHDDPLDHDPAELLPAREGSCLDRNWQIEDPRPIRVECPNPIAVWQIPEGGARRVSFGQVLGVGEVTPGMLLLELLETGQEPRPLAAGDRDLRRLQESTQLSPVRIGNNREAYAERWWLHVEPRSGMRAALAGLPRYVATPRVSKHRVFVWLEPGILLDSACIAIARDADYTFGVLHSRVHELWARGTGTQLREVESGFRYTPTTTFESYPFPHPTSDQRCSIPSTVRRSVVDRLRP